MGPASPRHSRERGNPERARAQLLPLDPRFRGGDGKRLGRRDPFKSGSQSCKPSGGSRDLVQQMKEQPAASGAHGPSSITIWPARATSNLLSRPVGVVPTTGSRALKQAPPSLSPALAAIIEAVEASISTFC